jgi:hypothetical protein
MEDNENNASETPQPASSAAAKPSVGHILRSARERAGIPADRLCADLRIAPSTLEALETGNYGVLAGAPYVRAMLVSLSRYLRLDHPFKGVGLDMRRVLDGGREFVFHGPPPRAGTRLTAQARIDDIYEKEGRRGGTMTFVVSVQEFRDESGKLVAEMRSTAIETGRPPGDEG